MLNQYIRTEKFEVEQIHVVKATRTCDICHKKIKKDYWKICRHHGDWGNDSVDSYEYWDVCSEECAKELVDTFFKMSGGKLSQPNTYELEIEHKNIPITNRDLEYDYDPRWNRECSSEINIIDLDKKELEEKCIEAIKDLPYGM